MKNVLPYLPILILVPAAHVGVAAILMKAARTPEPFHISSEPPAALAPASEPEKETPPPAPIEKAEPATTEVAPPAAPLPGKAPRPKAPLPPIDAAPTKIVVPPEMPVVSEPVGPPLPSIEAIRDLPGADSPAIVPEETGATAKPPIEADPPEILPEASSPAETHAAEPAPDASVAPENTGSIAAPATRPELQPPKPVIETATNREEIPPPTAPPKKVFREITREDLQGNRQNVEEAIRQNLPSAVEAFAPDTVDQNDIDAMIRNAHTDLRRRVNEMKASPPPSGAPSNR